MALGRTTPRHGLDARPCGRTEITNAVNAGIYRTSWLAPGERVTIEAWVRVKPTAKAGSQVARLITMSSISDASKRDVVEFAVQRH